MTASSRPLRGVFPILATCFTPDGAIDQASQDRLIEFCVEEGVHGLVTLANASEGHLLSEREKFDLSANVCKRVAGRAAVIVTVNHPSVRVACELARHAEEHGADAVMALPPFFGRWRPGLGEIADFFRTLHDAVRIPVVLQDHMLSDISLPVDWIAQQARELPRLGYVKLESGNILHKAKVLTQKAGSDLAGVFGGNSGIFLPEEVQMGCCGTMPACYMPGVFRKTWDLLEAGQFEQAVEYFTPYSRIAAYEKDVANRCVWKQVLVERGVIAHATVRAPAPPYATGPVVDQLMAMVRRVGLVGERSR